MNRRHLIHLAAIGALSPMSGAARAADTGVFDMGNLIAWCIVPFDAKRRGPEERAAMLRRLGFRRFAYDWRDEHIPTFDQELDALRKHGVSLDAFWFPCGREPERERHAQSVLDFLRRRSVKTQLWLSLNVPDQGSQEQRIETAARPIRYVAAEAAKLGCKVGLYNHGGWFGEPENQLAVVEHLKLPNVGIVYNFHHGHHRIEDFPAMLAKMQPHLLALNINGMRKEGPKILPVGKGDRELELLRAVVKSGYRGPIGILGHREDVDAELALRENLDGLKTLVSRFG